MFENLKKRFNLEWFSAFFTWSFVSVSTVVFLAKNESYTAVEITLSATLFVVYFVLWSHIIRDKPFKHDLQIRSVLIALAFAVVFTLYFLVPYTFVAILGVILCGCLSIVMPFRYAVLMSIAMSVPFWLIHHFYWGRDNMLLTTVLFWTFNLFALVMINSMTQAKAAQAHSEQINRELLATQSLLTEATKQSERVRIARNIHDLLGHHLTALTIKLQVAHRLSEGKAKSEIEACHQLAKLLLSDVREAVSEIRSKSQINLISAIEAIQHSTPKLMIELEVKGSVNVCDVKQAETILRAVQESVSNSLKHGSANVFTIRIVQNDTELAVQLQDNGSTASVNISEGNGLKGIKERVSELNGTFDYKATSKGFFSTIHLPLVLEG